MIITHLNAYYPQVIFVNFFSPRNTTFLNTYSGVSHLTHFGSNEFASNDPFEALSHLQSNDPKFISNGNYSGHPGLNFKLPADR